MKSEKGITLTSLVIYVFVATLLIGAIATLRSFFFSNIGLIKYQQNYALEFNKFSMFFVEDIKKNKTAEVTATTIAFEDGTTYQFYNNKIYRNDTVITEKVDSVNFSLSTQTVSSTIKQIITVSMSINGQLNSPNGIEYVLKYW